jgi:hypothetical protein
MSSSSSSILRRSSAVVASCSSDWSASLPRVELRISSSAAASRCSCSDPVVLDLLQVETWSCSASLTPWRRAPSPPASAVADRLVGEDHVEVELDAALLLLKLEVGELLRDVGALLVIVGQVLLARRRSRLASISSLSSSYWTRSASFARCSVWSVPCLPLLAATGEELGHAPSAIGGAAAPAAIAAGILQACEGSPYSRDRSRMCGSASTRSGAGRSATPRRCRRGADTARRRTACGPPLWLRSEATLPWSASPPASNAAPAATIGDHANRAAGEARSARRLGRVAGDELDDPPRQVAEGIRQGEDRLRVVGDVPAIRASRTCFRADSLSASSSALWIWLSLSTRPSFSASLRAVDALAAHVEQRRELHEVLAHHGRAGRRALRGAAHLLEAVGDLREEVPGRRALDVVDRDAQRLERGDRAFAPACAWLMLRVSFLSPLSIASWEMPTWLAA